MADSNEALALVLRESIAVFRSQKDLADRAVAQVNDAALLKSLHEETNSIAVIMQHLAGNMISRWTDFLASDGEKANRDRDAEFVLQSPSRETLLARWEQGWKTLFDTLESLTIDDLAKYITIRGEPHTVIRAINRQISHYGYHVGQIVMIARILAEGEWQTLTVPRGGSKQFNDRVWQRL